MKSQSVSIRPAFIILPVLLSIIIIISIFSPTAERVKDQFYRWLIPNVVMHDINCQNDTGWLKPVAEFIISQPTKGDMITSLSMLYVSPDQQLSSCVAGWNGKIFKSVKTDKHTLFEYASVTKVFTADMVLGLIREQKLSLDDKIVDILPELKNQVFKDPRVKNITIQHLLMHRGGFDRMQIGVRDIMFSPNPWCPGDIKQLANYQLQFTAGEVMRYSNMGYCLLGRVIEVKTKLRFRDAFDKYYNIKRSERFNFVDNESIVNYPNSAVRELSEYLKFFDFYAISSSAGLYGDAPTLAKLATQIEDQQHPNVFDVPQANGYECVLSQTKGCPVYMGYKVNKNPRLQLYWRDGSMPISASMLVYDNKGGVLVILNNALRSGVQEQALVRFIYDYRNDNQFY